MKAFKGILFGIIIISSLLIVLFKYTTPIIDGDTWWHIAYGQYMLDNKTLILDHAAFTWTPASNFEIYCAWVSQLVLKGLHSLGGINAMHFLSFFVILLMFGLMIYYAYKRKVLTKPSGLSVILVFSILVAYTQVVPKPDLFSMLLFFLATFVFVNLKDRGESAWKSLYF